MKHTLVLFLLFSLMKAQEENKTDKNHYFNSPFSYYSKFYNLSNSINDVYQIIMPPNKDNINTNLVSTKLNYKHFNLNAGYLTSNLFNDDYYEYLIDFNFRVPERLDFNILYHNGKDFEEQSGFLGSSYSKNSFNPYYSVSLKLRDEAIKPDINNFLAAKKLNPIIATRNESFFFDLNYMKTDLKKFRQKEDNYDQDQFKTKGSFRRQNIAAGLNYQYSVQNRKIAGGSTSEFISTELTPSLSYFLDTNFSFSIMTFLSGSESKSSSQLVNKSVNKLANRSTQLGIYFHKTSNDYDYYDLQSIETRFFKLKEADLLAALEYEKFTNNYRTSSNSILTLSSAIGLSNYFTIGSEIKSFFIEENDNDKIKYDAMLNLSFSNDKSRDARIMQISPFIISDGALLFNVNLNIKSAKNNFSLFDLLGLNYYNHQLSRKLSKLTIKDFVHLTNKDITALGTHFTYGITDKFSFTFNYNLLDLAGRKTNYLSYQLNGLLDEILFISLNCSLEVPEEETAIPSISGKISLFL